MNSKLEHRFWNKVNKMNSTECWDWNAAMFGVKQPQISRILNGQRCGGVL